MAGWLTLAAVAAILQGDAPPGERWEYARLYVVRDVAVVWNTTRGSVPIDSAVEYHAQALGRARAAGDSSPRIVPLVATLNRLGAEGWELVAVVDYSATDRGYVFKRRRA